MNVYDAAPNAKLLRYFESRKRQFGYAVDKTVGKSVGDVHGTHPDLIDRLWTELGAVLPEDCRAVVYGSAVLARPGSGIIFAFAGGSHTYAMRLPADLRDSAIRAGAKRIYHYRAYPQLDIPASTFDLDEIGDEWVFCEWFKDEAEWCKSAYAFAAKA